MILTRNSIKRTVGDLTCVFIMRSNSAGFFRNEISIKCRLLVEIILSTKLQKRTCSEQKFGILIDISD